MTETVEQFLARGGKVKQCTADDNKMAGIKVTTNEKGDSRYVGAEHLHYNRRGGRR